MTDNIFLEDAEIVEGSGLKPVRARRVRPRIGSERRYRSAPQARRDPQGGTLPALVATQFRPDAEERELRTILTEPLGLVELPSRVQRAAALAMAGIMTIALPPVGATMIVVNSVREADVRLSAQLAALGGLGVAVKMMLAVPYA